MWEEDVINCIIVFFREFMYILLFRFDKCILFNLNNFFWVIWIFGYLIDVLLSFFKINVVMVLFILCLEFLFLMVDKDCF